MFQCELLVSCLCLLHRCHYHFKVNTNRPQKLITGLYHHNKTLLVSYLCLLGAFATNNAAKECDENVMINLFIIVVYV